MNYEEAKKLKDAGFPQGGALAGDFICECGQSFFRPSETEKHDYAYRPTLPELVSVCSDLLLVK